MNPGGSPFFGKAEDKNRLTELHQGNPSSYQREIRDSNHLDNTKVTTSK